MMKQFEEEFEKNWLLFQSLHTRYKLSNSKNGLKRMNHSTEEKNSPMLKGANPNHKSILLVEPGYKTTYPPLALMRISTWHKREGDEVDFKKETPILRPSFGYKHPKLKTHYDIIYITSLFTFHYSKVTSCIRKYQKRYPNADIKVGGVLATLLPSKIEEETKIKPHVGLLKKVEECPPDYSLFPKLPYSITFTTRGCIRKCKYCVVPIIEPKFFTRNWKKDINPKSNRIVFWDNNWLCSPNFDKDVKKLKKLGKTFDFNQGLDCRLFDEEKAEILSQTKLKPLRFAFDGPAQAPYIEKAISNARKYGFNDIRVYVLYNSKSKYDTPAYFYKRINKLNKLKVVVFPMKYKPINSTAPNWVSPRWDSEVLRGLKIVLRFFYGNGLIKKDRTTFLEMFGEKSKEFKHKMIEFNQRDRARQSKKRSDVK